MTQNDIQAGQLICEIGVAPIKPAEFVIFRIGLHTAGAPAVDRAAAAPVTCRSIHRATHG